MLELVLGGARSGKSRYAMQRALMLSQRPVYIATAQASSDVDLRARIARHQQDRDPRFETHEQSLRPECLSLIDRTVLLDCVTLWLSAVWMEERQNTERIRQRVRDAVVAIQAQAEHLVLVSNEIGMGVHAATEVGRQFADLQGWVNQDIAVRADRVVLMVAGLPLVIKSQDAK